LTAQMLRDFSHILRNNLKLEIFPYRLKFEFRHVR
jgi:hypothetical protein